MKRYNLTYITFFIVLVFSYSCTKEKKDVLIPYPNDINFNELQLGRFSYQIPNAPFEANGQQSGKIQVNVVNYPGGGYGGFALSNMNWRSYPWSLSPDFGPGGLSQSAIQKAVDSCIFSVYTTKPNKTENYLVGHAVGDDAFITLGQPGTVESVLVANTTYNYLLTSYGSVYSGSLNSATQAYSITGSKVRNIQIPNPSTTYYGRWYLPGPEGTDLIRLAGTEILEKRSKGHAAADQARANGKSEAEATADSTTAAAGTHHGYVKLVIEGYRNNTSTGKVDFLLAVQPQVDPANPGWSFVMGDWNPVNLTSLGQVDRLVFRMESSYKDNTGKMLTPAYFCLDGIRIKK